MFNIPTSPSRYSLELRFQEGSSDKVYHVKIRPLGDDRWEVTASWGRRGSTLQNKVKATDARWNKAYETAYDLAREKTGKGYEVYDEQSEVADNTPSAPAPTPRKAAPPAPKKPDFIPSAQLAAPIDQTMIDACCSDDALLAQEKLFGERRMVVKTADRIVGYNRRGLEVQLPDAVIAAASEISGTFAIDGEAIGDVVHAFDYLERDGTDMARLPLDYRLARLALLGFDLGPAIPVVYTAMTPEDKRRLAAEIRERNGEGLVFKRRHGLYVPGRPAGEVGWLKAKFYDTLSAIIIAHNAQRSVALALKNDTDMSDLPVGNVTVPANADIPAIGSVVEIRYLFAYDNGGSLYEPVLLCARPDLTPNECLASQRKFKPPIAA